MPQSDKRKGEKKRNISQKFSKTSQNEKVQKLPKHHRQNYLSITPFQFNMINEKGISWNTLSVEAHRDSKNLAIFLNNKIEHRFALSIYGDLTSI